MQAALPSGFTIGIPGISHQYTHVNDGFSDATFFHFHYSNLSWRFVFRSPAASGLLDNRCMRCPLALVLMTEVLAAQTGAIHGVVKNTTGAPASDVLVTTTQDRPSIGHFWVLVSMQSIRWEAPEDLEKLLAPMSQATSLDLGGKADVKITVAPTVIQ
jgi:hypothetical protein